MSTSLGLLAVVGLILANGYFVAAEFAFVAVRRPRMDELAAAGNRRAQRAVAVTERVSFMLSGAQLGITVTSLVLGFIADRTLGAAIEPLLLALGLPEQASFGIALTIGFILATTVQMVLGELGPKNLAIAEPERFSLALAHPTWLFLRVAGPVIRLFDSSANALLRAVGAEPVEELAAGVSAEELHLIIDESSREGALDPGQASLLSRGLAFRSLRAVDAMVPRPDVATIDAEASCEDLLRLTRDTGHSRFPVTVAGLDDVLGVVQAKDIFAVDPRHRPNTPVRRLTQPALAVPESALLGPLLADLRAARTQLALVVDEHGAVAGIVTLEDIVEELVGEIEDEHDPLAPDARRLASGEFLVPGSWRLDEVVRDTGLVLPEGDYDTVSGLVMDRLGRVPRVGDVIETATATLRVLTLHGHAVGMARLTPIAQPTDDTGHLGAPEAASPSRKERRRTDPDRTDDTGHLGAPEAASPSRRDEE